MWATRIIYPLAWLGIVVTAVGILTQRASEPENPEDRVRIGIGKVVLATLVLQALLFGLMRVPSEPQYFFGTFVVQALLPWFALEFLRPRRLSALFGMTYGAAVWFVTLQGMIAIHGHGCITEPPWITLGSQVKAARVLQGSADATASTALVLCQQYPQALRALRLLLPPETAHLADGPLLIRASSNPSAPRGAIEVVELAPGTSLPPESKTN